jgi:hypothetical protein
LLIVAAYCNCRTLILMPSSKSLLTPNDSFYPHCRLLHVFNYQTQAEEKVETQ